MNLILSSKKVLKQHELSKPRESYNIRNKRFSVKRQPNGGQAGLQPNNRSSNKLQDKDVDQYFVDPIFQSLDNFDIKNINDFNNDPVVQSSVISIKQSSRLKIPQRKRFSLKKSTGENEPKSKKSTLENKEISKKDIAENEQNNGLKIVERQGFHNRNIEQRLNNVKIANITTNRHLFKDPLKQDTSQQKLPQKEQYSAQNPAHKFQFEPLELEFPDIQDSSLVKKVVLKNGTVTLQNDQEFPTIGNQTPTTSRFRKLEQDYERKLITDLLKAPQPSFKKGILKIPSMIRIKPVQHTGNPSHSVSFNQEAIDLKESAREALVPSRFQLKS